ncbi:MAG: MotA/TolQ/ExbB proton channel family protein [Thermoguttaceae bacterium]
MTHPSNHRLPGAWAARTFCAITLLLGVAAAVCSQEVSRMGPPPDRRAAPVADEEPIPTRNLWNIMQDGGVLMIPLAGCSLLLVALIFERLVSLRRGRIIPRPFVRRFLEQIRAGELERDAALQLCEENGSPVAEVFAGAVRKWGRPGVEVEQAIIDSGERVTNGLRRYLRLFNGIATVSPLLGLLGTVVGMIRAFNAIATSDAMGRPELLAAGISEALLTTAAGLSVAIPALIVYMYFVSRVDRLIIEIDALGQSLVNVISAEELEARGASSPAPKSRRSPKKEVA